jgi:hypothetical protein
VPAVRLDVGLLRGLARLPASVALDLGRLGGLADVPAVRLHVVRVLGRRWILAPFGAAALLVRGVPLLRTVGVDESRTGGPSVSPLPVGSVSFTPRMASETVRPSCPGCGQLARAGDRFCARCGDALAAQPARERRALATVLFCDLAGSTALGERLDPEALRDVQRRYFSAASDALRAHGGEVEKYIGTR